MKNIFLTIDTFTECIRGEEPPACQLFCAHGFSVDRYGCSICSCNPPQTHPTCQVWLLHLFMQSTSNTSYLPGMAALLFSCNTTTTYCDVPGFPCLSKMGSEVGPSSWIFVAGQSDGGSSETPRRWHAIISYLSEIIFECCDYIQSRNMCLLGFKIKDCFFFDKGLPMGLQMSCYVSQQTMNEKLNCVCCRNKCIVQII